MSNTTFATVLDAPYILSEDTKNKISDFLQSYSTRDNRITSLIKKEFPWISSFTYNYINSQNCIYRITLEEPFCALSNGYYISHQGNVFPEEILREEVYKKLPQIQFGSCMECSLTLGNQICLLDKELFDRYNIIWNSANYIILIDKQTECFPIITSLDKKITPQIAHYCHYIHKKIKESYTKKKKTQYALDIRFDKQIVLRPQEDIKYEKSSSS